MDAEPKGAARTISLPPSTRMGTVSLTVARLDRQISFYQDFLGLRLHGREGSRAGLGAGGTTSCSS